MHVCAIRLEAGRQDISSLRRKKRGVDGGSLGRHAMCCWLDDAHNLRRPLLATSTGDCGAANENETIVRHPGNGKLLIAEGRAGLELPRRVLGVSA